MIDEPFYRRIDDRTFDATASTRGPWSEGHQHGGPPAALLARAMEETARSIGTPVPLRFTFEILRPVPIGRVILEVEPSAEGRAVRRVRASMSVLGNERTEVLRAIGLFAAPRPVEIETALPWPIAPKVDEAKPMQFPFFRAPVGYHTAMEGRYSHGTFGEPRVFAWMRMRVPLVEGETPSPVQRVIVAADSGNGVTAALDWHTHNFLNPDLSVVLHGTPEGEWIGLEAEMRTTREGIGLASTVLWDANKPVGRGAQTLLVRKNS